MPRGAIPFPFGDCKICNDKATGFHYGVATCEGCKGFYKRSIPKGDKYTCFFGGNCNITPLNRNRCKACRFRRCLDHGMAIDAVKMGRIPKVEKERALLEASMNGPGSNEQKCDTPDPNMSMWSDPNTASTHNDTPRLGVAGPDRSHTTHLTHTPHPTQSQAAHSTTTLSQPRVSNHQTSVSEAKRTLSDPESSMLNGVRSRDLPYQGPNNGLPAKWEENFDAVNSSSYHGAQQQIRRSHSLDVQDLNDSSWYGADNQHGSSRDWSGVPNHGFPKVGVRPHHENVSRLERNFSMDSPVSHSSMFASYPSHSLEPSASLPSMARRGPLGPDCQDMGNNRPGLGNAQMGTGADSMPLFGKMAFNRDSEQYRILGEEKIFKSEPNVDDTGFPFNNKLEMDRGPENHYAQSDAMTPSSAQSRHNNSIQSTSSMGHCWNQNTFNNGLENEPIKPEVRPQDIDLVCYPKKGIETASSVPAESAHEFVMRPPKSKDMIKALLDQLDDGVLDEMKEKIISSVAKKAGQEELRAAQELLEACQSSQASHKQIDLSAPFIGSGDVEDVSFEAPSFSVSFDNHLCHSIASTHIGNGTGVAPPQNLLVNTSSFSSSSSSSLSSLSPPTSTTSLSSSFSKSSAPKTLSLAPSHFTNSLSVSLSQTDTPQNNNFISHQQASGRNSISLEQNDQQYSGNSCTGDPSLNPQHNSTLTRENHENHEAMDTSEDCGVKVNGGLEDGKLAARSCVDNSPGSDFQNAISTDESCDSLCRELALSSLSDTALELSAAFYKNSTFIRQRHATMMEHLRSGKETPFHKVSLEMKPTIYKLIVSGLGGINAEITGFCTHVPGFLSLDKEDQKVLIKRAYYDIWMLTNCRMFHNYESYLLLSDGTYYTRAWMEMILNKYIVEKIINYAMKFNSLGLSDLEVAILCAIQLTTPGHDYPGLKWAEGVQQLNTHYVDLLVHEVSKLHPANCSRILVDIFRLMPALAEINTIQREIIANFQLDKCPEKVDSAVDKPDKTTPLDNHQSEEVTAE